MPRWVAISSGKNAARATNTSLAPSPRPNQAVSSGTQANSATWRSADRLGPSRRSALRQAQQQAQGKASAAAQQQPGQGALQAQAQGFAQRAIQQPGRQAAQRLQWRGEDVGVDPAKAVGGLPQPSSAAAAAGSASPWRLAAAARRWPVAASAAGALQARKAAVHQRADQADHQDAEEHQVEHEQLPQTIR
jgi:hypothetical protein